MFTAWVQDSDNTTVKQHDDVMKFYTLTENEMHERFPEIIDAIGFSSDYTCIVNSQGNHFYPLYVYSINIG